MLHSSCPRRAPYADADLAAHRAQRGRVDHDAGLVVGGAAPVQAALADDRLERRRGPLGGRSLGLHVVVGVQQRRRGALGARQLPEHGGVSGPPSPSSISRRRRRRPRAGSRRSPRRRRGPASGRDPGARSRGCGPAARGRTRPGASRPRCARAVRGVHGRARLAPSGRAAATASRRPPAVRCSRAYRKRSCSRCGGPARTRWCPGRTRKPPQFGGRGTSIAGKRSPSRRAGRSSSSRSPAPALRATPTRPVCASRGRVAKYASDSSGIDALDRPVTFTWRSSCFHRNTRPACGFSASWRPLRLS